MSKIAIFPGSFCPISLAHQDVIERGLRIFDKIILAIGSNIAKNSPFSLEERKFLIEKALGEKYKGQVEILDYSSLTVELCKELDAKFLLRGLRNTIDFEYEKSIALANMSLNNKIETVFLLSDNKYTHISSSLIRDVLRFGGDLKGLVAEEIIDDLLKLRGRLL